MPQPSVSHHSAYHSALRNGLDFELKRIDGVYYCNVLYDGVCHDNICPLCGRWKYKTAKRCMICYNNDRHRNYPPMNDLINHLKHKCSIVSISKIYGVSDNMVRKWLKYYNLPYKKKDIDDYVKTL